MSRFSQLFSPPAVADLHKTKQPRQAQNKQQKRRSLSNLFVTLLQPKKKNSKEPPASTRNFSLRSSSAPKTKSHTPIVLHPPFTDHATTIDSIPSIKQRTTMRDSIYSISIASSDASFYTCNSVTRSTRSSRASSVEEVVTIILSAPDIRKLQSLVRRATRGLQKQEWLTTGLSGNLAVMMARKEASVELNRKMTPLWRTQVREICMTTRTLVGRTFMRKAVFSQRSLQVLQGLGGQIGEWKEGENIVDIEGLLANLGTLKDDIAAQEAFDGALRQGIKGTCEDRRFLGTETDRMAVERFVGFLDGRLDGLGDCYERTRVRAEEIEQIITGLRTIDC